MMRSIAGLIFVVIATVALFLGVYGVFISAGWSKTVLPFGPIPVYAHARWLLASVLLGWGGVRLLKGSYLDRLVRGRGLTPERRSR